MSTPSTKSSVRKKKQARKAAATEQKISGPAAPAGLPDLPDRVWWIGVLVILLIAATLRFYDLNLVPLHHDEGVNGNFLVRLVREGEYHYDPENYHGPTLYYFAALIPWITRLLFGVAARDNYGMTTFTIRLIPVLFGLGTIGLVFCLRNRLGRVATLAAGLMLAISPGAVYLSRYFIHESQFVFFTLGIVVAAVRLYDTRNPFYLAMASACAALLLATKETAIISVAVLLIAFGVTHLYRQVYRAAFMPRSAKIRSGRQQGAFRRFLNDFGGWAPLVISLVIALAVGAMLYVAFYSSFFTNSKGISDSFKTFETWSKTGQSAHVYPGYRYIEWLVSQESPLLFLGAIGAAITVWKPKNSLALFSGLWAFGLIAAYSLIPYKTPWLVLNFLIPLALVSGYVAQFIYELDGGQVRLVAMMWVIVAAVSAYQMIDLNFINYDNDKSYYVYVYAHTTRGMLDLVKDIDEIAAKTDGPTTGISIFSPDYWPLPWYLRNYSRVGYYTHTAATSEPIIIASEKQKAEVDADFGAVYKQVPSKAPDGTFELRPGVRLLLYQRR